MAPTDRSKAPEVHSLGRLAMPRMRRRVLDNGISLTIYDGTTTPVNRIMAVIDGGAIEMGLPTARLLGAMPSRGSRSWPGRRLTEALDFNGSWQNCWVGNHHTLATVFSLNSRLNRVARPIAEMVFNPGFSRRSFSVVRDKAVSQAMQNLSRAEYLASTAADRLGRGADYGTSLPVDGVTLGAVTLNALRRRWHDMLNPRHVRLYLSGNIDAATEETVAQAFGRVPEEGWGRGCRLPSAPFCPAPPGTVERIAREGSVQAAISAVLPLDVNPHDADYVDLPALATLFGGYFGSRLMTNIREEKGLTYGINAGIEAQREGCMLRISTQCRAGMADRVLDEVRAEMRALADPSTYSADEIDSLRKYMATLLASSFDSPFRIMDLAIRGHMLNEPRGVLARQQDALAIMTPERLAALAATYFDADALRVAIVE